MNNKEIWKDIKGYEGLYQVSNLGRIKSMLGTKMISGKLIYIKREKILSTFKINNNKPYLRIGLNKNKQRKCFLVHRLVAEAFIPNPENKPQVNHIDGNKQNNNVNNLEWVNNQENKIHASKNNLITKLYGEKNPKSRKVIQYDLNYNFIKKWGYIRKAANLLNISEISICNCCRKKAKTAGGFVWRYADENQN